MNKQIIWVYFVNSLYQEFYVTENKFHTKKRCTIDEGLFFLSKLVLSYPPEVILLQAGDLHSEEYANQLRTRVADRMLDPTKEFPKIEVKI